MYQSSSPSLRDTSGENSFTSAASAADTFLAGFGDSQSPMQQLRSVVAELFAALTSTLNDERGSAEDSLSRAAEILRAVNAAQAVPRQEAKGGLAPWQVRKVKSYVDANLDMPIKSSELAGVARLSPCHFSRVFRASFGCSPHEYVTRRRVEHAQRLMLSTNAPLCRIALDCGLADQAHFSRLFRRFVGETPRSWRRARVDPMSIAPYRAQPCVAE
jgi:AraC family transcriptional regulator